MADRCGEKVPCNLLPRDRNQHQRKPSENGSKKDKISRTRGRELCSPSPPSPNMQWLYLGWVMGELGGGGGGGGGGSRGVVKLEKKEKERSL